MRVARLPGSNGTIRELQEMVLRCKINMGLDEMRLDTSLSLSASPSGDIVQDQSFYQDVDS